MVRHTTGCLAWCFFLGGLGLTVVSGAERPVVPSALKPLQDDLFYLAGDECEGRGMETQGIQKAGVYIAKQFEAAGLKPAGTEGYFQPFTFGRLTKLGEGNHLKFRGPDGAEQVVVFQRDFRPLGSSASGEFQGDFVFAGYGVQAPKLNYDDFAGIELEGKVVVLLRRTPFADQPNNPFDKDSPLHAALVTKIQLAEKAKAKAVLFVNDATYAKPDDPLIEFRTQGETPAKIPVIHMKRAVLEKLLASQKQSLSEIETSIGKELKPASVAFPHWTVSLKTNVQVGGLPARNVVAVSEGSGPLANETVVIGAHYDHLGFGETGMMDRTAKGKLHYGADDNASGTTGLLEIARRVGKMKNRVGRRIVFIAFAAEERGLYGSIHYCKEPSFPLDQTVFMINMDMIGRMVPVDATTGKTLEPMAAAGGGAVAAKTKGRVVVYGTGTAEGLESFVDATNQSFDLKLIKVPGGTGPSDHDSFYRKKIPVLFFFTGTHRDYHRPSDTPEKVNLVGLEQIASFAERSLLHFASTPERPKYVVTKGGWSDPTEERPVQSSRAGAPRLGIMPGNYESTSGGVLVDELTPGGAAEKAGIKPKDVIIEIAGKPIKDIEAYMTVMRGTKAGTEIEIVVLRGEKKVTIKATPTP